MMNSIRFLTNFRHKILVQILYSRTFGPAKFVKTSKLSMVLFALERETVHTRSCSIEFSNKSKKTRDQEKRLENQFYLD